ncbi:hypothetical protein IMG5_049990 [Ichthyophthirius multifiliis]|uniref:Protein kinase domain protein n=1 Tax=Ichthyophthirius multifiliis TaxID=5932 RepID=G0QMM0_ICHMU|nr:hypothetical protein IMG5_049990 [Ichthyophthirius multifiliis]EGR33539.1 hypothetical protein IMG5_049990 [Ichthyophthirius multifiliis]|eukprot:XP_004037525.1 hypothetical protein IMG5_049990 [Ichthyophthirius multifiliis]
MQQQKTQLLIDHEIISRRYKHVGVLGKGRDFMYEVPSVIHMMQDKFNEKKVIMQIFPALNEEILKMKLYQLKQSNFDNYISNWIRIIGYTTKKQNKSTSDLIILYQVDGIIGPTLENIISKHKKDNQSFSEQEILEYIYIMCESMKVSQTSEYLDLSPVNIFVPPENTPTKAKYYISNCGLSFKGTKWDKKFYCPTDSFFTVKISERNAHMATIIKIALFIMKANFQDGQKTNGLQYYKDGFKYIGEFKQDKKQGKGQLFWPKSVKNWVGEFIDDQMHGKGKMTIFRNEESKEIEVEFEKGIEKNGQEI